MKARLIGISIDYSTLTTSEMILAMKIISSRDDLIKGWDEESETFLGHPLPPYKCSSCGKRSEREYIIEGQNFCSKHYKLFTNV